MKVDPKHFFVRAPDLLWHKRKPKERVLVVFCACLIIFLFLELIFWAPPSNFPTLTTIAIPKGTTLGGTADKLLAGGYIRSEFSFKVFVFLFGGSRAVTAGDYFFENPQSVIPIAWRMVHGSYGLKVLRVTIPEGTTIFQVADIFKKRFSLFDAKVFLEQAKEGYMFPDTYFFLPNVTAEDVISRMTENFNEQTHSLQADMLLSGHSLNDIVTMASIIEEEANDLEAQKIISGILWKRISIKMPLQVDATFAYYVNGKNSYTLSKTDLKTDSPYNTYTNKGLPPGPISSPGIQALKAAISPIKTDYLYFLSDLKGKMYYAKDFAGHQKNRELYLRR